MNLPGTHTLEGSVEGKRTLYENRKVYRIVPGDAEAPVEHERRKVATFSKKCTRRQIERIAWFDFNAQEAKQTGNPSDRRFYLEELAREFRGESLLEVAS